MKQPTKQELRDEIEHLKKAKSRPLPGHEIDTGKFRTPEEKAWDEGTRG